MPKNCSERQKLLEVAGTAKSYSERQKLLKSCRAQTWQAYWPRNTNSLRSPLRNGLQTVYILLQVVNARSWVARNTSRIKLNLFSLKMLVLRKVILKVVFKQKKKIDPLPWSIIYCSNNYSVIIYPLGGGRFWRDHTVFNITEEGSVMSNRA